MEDLCINAFFSQHEFKHLPTSICPEIKISIMIWIFIIHTIIIIIIEVSKWSVLDLDESKFGERMSVVFSKYVRQLITVYVSESSTCSHILSELSCCSCESLIPVEWTYLISINILYVSFQLPNLILSSWIECKTIFHFFIEVMELSPHVVNPSK